jgi:IS5 family transposase
VAVDQGTGLVRRARITPANVAEVSIGHELVMEMRAPSTSTKPMSARPCARGSRPTASRTGSSHRAQKNRPLSPRQHLRNRLIGRVRGRVEGVFGALKRSYGMARMRYMGLTRNAAATLITLTAWNLARAAGQTA